MNLISKISLTLGLLLLSMLAYGQENYSANNTSNTAAEAEKAFVENEFIIWLEEGVDAAEFAANSSEQIKPKQLLSKSLNIWLFEITNNSKQRGAIFSNLSRNGNIKHIQNNHINLNLREKTPDDPLFSQQWAPTKMQLPLAWEKYTTGGYTATGDTIVVAVIDQGFALNHEDLNYWKNTREIPNNGIDDDNNGYIDDYDGWNAYSNNANIPSDSHGTHVAGIIGAIGNNGKGVAGANWNVKVMPIAGSSGTESTVVAAYSYALEMRKKYNETNGKEGAFVVATNSSFGIDYGNPANFPIWCSMYDEMGKLGILSSAASPNRHVNVDQVGDMPSTCSSNYVIGITNTTSADVKNSAAGYGVNNIDIGAPGTDILSTVPGNSYRKSTGTSMATPQVSGVIALMYAAMPEAMIQAYKNDPAIFALTVKQHLLDGADKLASLDGLVANSRRLNAHGAIEKALGNLNSIDEILSGSISIYPNPAVNELRVESGEYQINKITLFDTTGKNLRVNSMANSGREQVIDLSQLSPGVYFIRLELESGVITKKFIKK